MKDDHLFPSRQAKSRLIFFDFSIKWQIPINPIWWEKLAFIFFLLYIDFVWSSQCLVCSEESTKTTLFCLFVSVNICSSFLCINWECKRAKNAIINVRTKSGLVIYNMDIQSLNIIFLINNMIYTIISTIIELEHIGATFIEIHVHSATEIGIQNNVYVFYLKFK